MVTNLVLQVLMIDDDEDDVWLAEDALRQFGYTVAARRVDTAEALNAALLEQAWDLIVSDYRMPTLSGLEALAITRAHGIDLPFILMSGTVGEEIAVEAMRAGADDYILKGNLARLVPSVQRALGAAIERRRRRQAEEALRASEGRYRSLVETSPDAIVLHDLHGTIQMANQQAADLYHYTNPGSLIGRNAVEFVAPADRERAATALEDVAAGAVRTNLIFTALRHDGSTFALELQATRVDADGTGSIMIVARDVTVRLAVEAARLEAEAARIASEARYRLIVETANEGIWHTNSQLVVVFVNQAMAAMLGYTVDEMVGAPIARFVEDLDSPTRAAMVQARRAGSTAQFEVPFRRKDGSQLCLLASGRSIQETDGTSSGILTMFTDITARKEAEARLIAERDLLRTLMDAVPDAIYIKDTQSRFLRVNAAQARSLGAATPEAVVGRTDLDFYPQALAERFTDQERRVLATGDPILNDLEDQSSRGPGKRWTLSSMSPVRQGGRITGLVGISRDITAFKQAEEERQRFFELSLDLLCVATMDGYFKSVNPAFESTLGFTPEEMCGEPFLSFVHPDDQAATLAIVATLADGIPAVSFENRYRAKDGTYRWLLWTAVPVPAEGLLYATARDITERKKMEALLHKQIGRISALHAIDTTIAASLDLRVTLGVALDQVCTQLGVDAAQVLLLDKHLLILEPAADRGFRASSVGGAHLRLGQGHAGRAALEQRLITVPDLRCEEVVRTSLMVVEGFTAYAAAPLVARGQVLGVLEVFHRSSLAQESDWLDFLRTLAGQVAIAVDNAALFRDLQQSNTGLVLAYDTTIEGWSRALDLRDKETEGHTQRVTKQTLLLAQAMDVQSAELVQMRRGALLHDIGKMGVPDAILLKPGPLTDEEWVLMRKHPTYAFELLSAIAYLRPALDIPYCHHEKWDGTGYPRGLVGEHIPLAARIFAVTDVADALLSDRPYRAGWQPDRVRAHIASLSGSYFDPSVVAVFLALSDDPGDTF